MSDLPRFPADASPPGVPRFGQLTYARLLGAGGSGGWQMKAVAGRITSEEQELLVAAVTDVEADAPPVSLTADAVDALPRRLVHGPAALRHDAGPTRLLPAGSRPPMEHGHDAGATAYWHAVPTGIDHTGRPDRVFAHVVLDRAPGTSQPPLRPSDLLRSPAWLRPYGAEQLLAATPDAVPDPPWPGTVLDRAAVLAFLTDKALWRGGTLRGLLDAVHAAMQQQGPTVVLGVVDPEDADRWVAAVCHLMSPGASRRLYFATAEHVAGLNAARAAGLHLIVVPAAELSGVEPDDGVVLISDEDLLDGHPSVEFVDYGADPDADQIHLTSFGSRIRATPWSMIAADVLRDPAVAAAVLDRQDAIAAEVGDHSLSCEWPLALAVAERALDRREDGGQDVVDDALLVADLVVRVAPIPPEMAGTPLHRTLERVRERALGRTAADAWAALTGGLPPGVDPSFAKGVYLQRALQDRQWLLRDDGVPVPDMFGAVSRLADDVVEQAHAALDSLGAEAAPDAVPDAARTEATSRPLEPAAVALRVLDLAARVGLAAHLDPARFTDVLDKVVGPVLLHALTGPELVERVGPLTETVQARTVRPWLDRLLPQLSGRPGCRLAPLVLRWLFPEPPAPPPPSAVPPATILEAAAQASLVLPDRSAFRAVALTADLTAPASGITTRAALGPGLPVNAVLGLLEHVEPRRLVDVLGRALLCAPSGPELDTLLQRLAGGVGQPEWDTPAGRAVRQAVQLRALEVSWHRLGEESERQPGFRRFARLLRPLVHAATTERTDLAADLVASGAAADVVDRIHGFDEDAGAPLAQQSHCTARGWDVDAMTALAGRVADAVRTGTTTDLQVVLAAQLGANTVNGVSLGPASWSTLADLSLPVSGGGLQRLVDHVVWLRMPELQRNRPDELHRLVAGARQWVERAVGEHRDHIDPHRALADYDRIALPWWRRQGVPDDEPARVLARRVWRSS